MFYPELKKKKNRCKITFFIIWPIQMGIAQEFLLGIKNHLLKESWKFHYELLKKKEGVKRGGKLSKQLLENESMESMEGCLEELLEVFVFESRRVYEEITVAICGGFFL